MGYFNTLSYLAGYHVALILLSAIGIIRFPRSNPQRWFAAGFVIQLIINLNDSGDVPVSLSLLYLVILSLLLQGIIRLQASFYRK